MLAAAALTVAACQSPRKATFASFAYSGHDARFERTIDARNEYLNPVIAGFYSDPSICRKGDDYFLVTSTFAFYPALPVFHSRDMVHWRQIGSAIDRPDQLPLDSLGFNRAVYAPDISYNPHNDTFYIINTCVDGIENYVIKCRDPFEGNWSDPIALPEVEGIDPSLFFDDDGKAYLLHNGMPPQERQWNSHRALWMWEYDTDNDRVVGQPTLLLDGGLDFAAQPEWLEGPRVYKRNGRYYLLAAEGGTYEYHSQIALSADNALGPYTPCAINPILTQRDLPEQREDKVTCTGHADIIETPDGEWYAIFHGCRPYDGNHYNTGRETFLLPVEWTDDTPVILAAGEAVPTVVRKSGLESCDSPTTGNFAWSTDFAEGLDGRWIMIRTPRHGMPQTSRRGLTLSDNGIAISTGTASPSFVGFRQQHTSFDASTRMTFTPSEGAFAGIALYQNDRHYILFGKTLEDGAQRLIVERCEKDSAERIASLPLTAAQASGWVELSVACDGGSCAFSASFADGTSVQAAGGVDARNLSTHVARGFNGVIIGPYTGPIE